MLFFYLLAQPFAKTGSSFNWSSRISKTIALILFSVQQQQKKSILGLGSEFSQFVCPFWFVSHIILAHITVRNDSESVLFVF